MLSRDEELQRLQSYTGGHMREEGMSDTPESPSHSGSDQSSLSSSPTQQYSPPSLYPSASGSSTSSHGDLVPLVPPSSSNIKVQVSPYFYLEPKEAGGLHVRPPDSQSVLPQGSPSSPPRSSHSILGPTSTRINPSEQIRSGIDSPGKPNAWSKPLPSTASSKSPLSSPSRTNWEAERIRQVEDLELRLALELSLAEAQSRERSAGDT